MLVRELIEQLSEMPSESPVIIELHEDFAPEVHGAIKTGRLRPNNVALLVDIHEMAGWAVEYSVEVLRDHG